MLITTNNGPAYLYRNDQLAGNRSIRFRLRGTKSNRDAHRRHGAYLLRRANQLAHGAERIELSVAVGTAGDVRAGQRESIDRAVIRWPNGRVEEFKNLKAGGMSAWKGREFRGCNKNARDFG